ncbi:MAG: hypothetical protein EBQ56_18325 [Proteobacteria bacterium]|jgi:hypothetical protein|nr:hypothetical protein [Pseudomonadota bacterium]NBX47192.1 hypothetical protein [Chloroflexota bacterium]NBQ30593.1 hypothetical protein [Pseudomonadota bacterium]NBQ61665.1 hypothetical protein [Pseudomonadota bacterium]NBT03955.1 hypothetical protein [Pseudomonadota bacterium]
MDRLPALDAETMSIGHSGLVSADAVRNSLSWSHEMEVKSLIEVVRICHGSMFVLNLRTAGCVVLSD